ncbi:MAG: hypothetical protein U0587_16615 [Candidatus Binatia bacterium]
MSDPMSHVLRPALCTLLVAIVACGCAARAPHQRSCTLVIDWNTSRPPGERGLWLVYLMKRARWHELDRNCGETETVVVPSFEEEVHARVATVKTYRALQQGDPALDVRYFNDLANVAEAGYLREYVWSYLHQPSWTHVPDGLNVAEFDRWRDSNLRNHEAQTEGSIRFVAGDE